MTDSTVRKNRVLYQLQDHHWHTREELERAGGGLRIASRIYDLRQEGHDIDAEWYDRSRGSYMYRLKEEK